MVQIAVGRARISYFLNRAVCLLELLLIYYPLCVTDLVNIV